MARTSNLSSRIERILNAGRFRVAFAGGRPSRRTDCRSRTGCAACGSGLHTHCACGRGCAKDRNLLPRRRASRWPALLPLLPGPGCAASAGSVAGGTCNSSTAFRLRLRQHLKRRRAPLPPANLPATPPTPSSDVDFDEDNDGGQSFAIIHGDHDSDIHMHDYHSHEFEATRKSQHGDYIWFERDGKSYIITDPKIVAEGSALFKKDPALARRQAELNHLQASLDQEMKNLQPEIERASKLGPEFQAKMDKLTRELAELQTDKLKDLDKEIAQAVKDNQKMSSEAVRELTQEKLGDLQEKIGDIQGEIGDLQGKIGERQGELGEKQGRDW